MVSVLMLKSIGNIDYDYLKEIENNITKMNEKLCVTNNFFQEYFFLQMLF